MIDKILLEKKWNYYITVAPIMLFFTVFLVGLARAVIQNPSVLILDEPTTGMDMGLERQMISHLKTVTADKTVIVITHRYAALELVDRVMVVNNGRIVADGPRDIILSKLQNPNGAGS